MKVDKNAFRLIELLHGNNFEAYLVGGCVRDLLLEKAPKDWDICTNAKPNDIIKLFKENNIRFCTPGIEFGTVVAVIDGHDYEVTTYRAETAYRDSRHPDEVKFIGDLKGDLSRRDFTINAMAYNPIKDELIDYFDGQLDLERKIIRTVGRAEERFSEDALRILRALRFAIRYNFKIDCNTANAMEYCAQLLDNISKERVTSELEKMFTCGNEIRIYFNLFNKIICRIIPELKPCVGFNQNNKYHTHNVYEHMLYVVDYCNTNKFEIKLAALLHDIGKPKAYVEDENGHGHFYEHPEDSYEICKRVLRDRLRLTCEQETRVLNLVRYHDMNMSNTKKSVKRALNKHGEAFLLDWFILKQADMDDHIYPNKNHIYCMDLDSLKELMIEIINANECFTLKDLKINGKIIMEITNTKPGKHIGNILNSLLDKVLEEEIINEEEVLKEEAIKLFRSL